MIENVDTIRVHLSDGSIHIARVIARAQADLAMIKIDAGRPLPTLRWARRAIDGGRIGHHKQAFGYENSATTGIVSFKVATFRSIKKSHKA